MAVAQLPVGVIVVVRPGAQVAYANEAAKQLVHPAKIHRGSQLPEAWPPFSLREYARRVVESGAGSRAEERVSVEDGRVFAIIGVATRASNSAVLLIEDVSGRDQRSRVEREFVANAAHELMTPLTGIVGAAHVLQAGAKEVPEERDRFIEHIAHECARLTRVARSLLVLARAQSGEEAPRREILSVCALIGEAVEIVRAERTTVVVVECDPDTKVLADADLVIQALVNLVGNAVRHGSGELLFRVETADGAVVHIDIVDPQSGASVASFQRRFQTGSGRDAGGFGLGLSIAGQSLEATGGALVLDAAGDLIARIELPAGDVD